MPTKTEANLFFRAIRNDDLATVKSMLKGNSEFLHACRKAPPKKDDGQSPLQVAFKTGRFAIARLLLDQGANVNFMEQSKLNKWRAPVLHDCLTACAFNAHRDEFPEALALLKRMLKLGADPNAQDSYGNTCFDRFLGDVHMQNHFQKSGCWPQMLANFRKVCKALVKSGADVQPARWRVKGMDTFYEQHLQ